MEKIQILLQSGLNISEKKSSSMLEEQALEIRTEFQVSDCSNSTEYLYILAVVYAFGLKVCVCIHIEQSKQLDLALCSLSLKRKIVLFCTEFCHHVHTLLFPV